jgi:type I restriction enzyme S subunit
MEKNIYRPELRFPEFNENWSIKKFGSITERISLPVDVQIGKLYQQIGIRSHGKGIFYKENVDGRELGNKRVFWIKENVFIVNIVFAWEQAVAKTTEKEIGMIASHRFPMYAPLRDESDLNYLLYFFLTKKGKALLELASPGGAGRNKTLGQKELEILKLIIPKKREQQEIASFLSAVDDKLQALKKKKSLLDQYKQGVMQKIFSQELRFKDDDGSYYPEWEVKKLGDIAECLDNLRKPLNSSERQKMQGKYPYWGANNIMDYINDYIFDETIVLLAEDGGNFNEFKTRPIANLYKGKCWVNNHTHVLRAIYKISTNEFLFYSLVHKDITGFVSGGTRAKLTKGEMLKIPILLPSVHEQTKIADFLSAIDEKTQLVKGQVDKMEVWKNGLLQKMFV